MTEKTITITATMTEEVAYQFAQFLKRSTFETFHDFTEAHLPKEERTKRTHLMILGVEAVQAGLKEAGFDPR
jgi:hypothetical protein